MGMRKAMSDKEHPVATLVGSMQQNAHAYLLILLHKQNVKIVAAFSYEMACMRGKAFLIPTIDNLILKFTLLHHQ